MPERIANVVVLVEDTTHQNLVRRYLERCRHNVRHCRFVSLPAGKGSGEKHVRDRYAQEVHACRSSRGKTKALLVVMIDADMRTVAERERQLEEELRKLGEEDRRLEEPIAVLIPKRHVETWIRALLGAVVDEVTDYTKAPHDPPRSADIRQAAETLYQLTRPTADVLATSPPSLAAAIPEWRRIPS